jgi:hypothetical protein
VVPQPASAPAATRAIAALNKRLVFFKIPYLDEKRGAYRGVNEMMAVAGQSGRGKKSPARNRFLPGL